MAAEAKRLGFTAQFVGQDSDDAAVQVAILESMLAKKPAGIAISPNDPASVTAIIALARDAGIPVIAWDGPVANSKVAGYAGPAQGTAGGQEGEGGSRKRRGQGGGGGQGCEPRTQRAQFARHWICGPERQALQDLRIACGGVRRGRNRKDDAGEAGDGQPQGAQKKGIRTVKTRGYHYC